MLFDDAPAADPNDPDEQRALVALSLAPGVGPARVRALLARFGSARRALEAPARLLGAVEGVGPQTAAAIPASAADGLAAAERHFRMADRAGATFLALTDPDYPARLKRIYDPPPYLWVLGRLTPEDSRAVAVVGTRKASDYGRRVAELFGGGLAEAGLTVVSGLAYGIDYAAHRAALDAGGRTVAVLGSGVDRIYPSRHAPLVRRIVDEDRGAVISEFAPGAAPDASNFPRRNRIIAGLSVGVVVAEARASGGALITAT
ncbi:MAG TPA: DNA-processing protein DprA, partial [Rhodothermales bacterium]|nr:DNA-processing protein DprA [Rhodothermales bacterium]